MSAVIAPTNSGVTRPKRTFGQKLITATWQYGICVFGGMFVFFIYTLAKRFPAFGALAAAFLACGSVLLTLVVNRIYQSPRIDTISAALQEVRHILFK